MQKKLHWWMSNCSIKYAIDDEMVYENSFNLSFSFTKKYVSKFCLDNLEEVSYKKLHDEGKEPEKYFSRQFKLNSLVYLGEMTKEEFFGSEEGYDAEEIKKDLSSKGFIKL